MKKRLLYKRLVIITSVLVFFLFITVFTIGHIRNKDFVFYLLDSLFSDTRLTRDSKPIPESCTPSTALLLGYVSPSDIKRIVFVRMLPVVDKQEGAFKDKPTYDPFNWGYQYPSFPKVELSQSQLEELLSAFRKAQLFSEMDVLNDLLQYGYLERKQSSSDSRRSLAVTNSITRETGASNEDLREIVYRAEYKGQVAELQIYLPRRCLARLRIYWDAQRVAFLTGLSYNVGVSGFGPESLDLVCSYHELARIPPLRVEFPDDMSQSALKRARRKFGKSYGRIIDDLKHGEGLSSVFGRIDDIRPAKELNHMGVWADSSWETYTFLVSSNGKQGLVLVTDLSKQLLYNEAIYEF